MLATKKAGQALSEMLAANTVLKKLDLSPNYDDLYSSHAIEFAQELAVGIRDNGAISSVNLHRPGPYSCEHPQGPPHSQVSLRQQRQ
jgi:hypothetical protein